MSKRLHVVLVCLLSMVWFAGCKKDGDGDAKKAPEAKPIPKPAHGAPLAVEFKSFEGEGEDAKVNVRIYNHGPKDAAGYVLLVRYFDAEDKPMRVQVGTAFENDSAFVSYSGGKFRVDAKKDLEIAMEFANVPAGAKRAEVIASKVDAAKGREIEPWFNPENWRDWPEPAKAK